METKINYEKSEYAAVEAVESFTIKDSASVKLPATFASVGEIVFCRGSLLKIEAFLKNGAVCVAGVVRLSFLYKTDEDSTAYFYEDVDFETKRPGCANEENKVYALGEVLEVNASMQSSRSINASLLIDVCVFALASHTYDNLCQLEEDMAFEALESPLTLSRLKYTKTGNTYSFDVKNTKDLGRILCVEGFLHDVRKTQSDSGVLLYGVLDVMIVGEREEDGQSVCDTILSSYTINHFIEKPAESECALLFTKDDVTLTNWEICYNDEGSAVRVEFDLHSEVFFEAKVTLKQIRDLYLIGCEAEVLFSCKTENAQIGVFNTTFEACSAQAFHTALKDILFTRAYARAVPTVSEQDIHFDIEVFVQVCGMNEKGELRCERFSYKTEENLVNEEGVQSLCGIVRIVRLTLDNTDEGLGICAALCFEGCSVGALSLSVVEKVDVLDPAEELAERSMVHVHFKQPADTLFSIAKKAHIRREDVLTLNKIKSLDDVQNGYPLILR